MNSNPQPSRWTNWLLEAFGDPNTVEEVQGDLLELYDYWVEAVGEREARWRYTLSVLKLLHHLHSQRTRFRNQDIPAGNRRPSFF
jgi:putative ABC transport system permease protein